MESVKFISRKLSRPSLYFIVTLALELLLAVRYCSAGYLHKDEILLSLIYARFASNVTRSPA